MRRTGPIGWSGSGIRLPQPVQNRPRCPAEPQCPHDMTSPLRPGSDASGSVERAGAPHRHCRAEQRWDESSPNRHAHDAGPDPVPKVFPGGVAVARVGLPFPPPGSEGPRMTALERPAPAARAVLRPGPALGRSAAVLALGSAAVHLLLLDASSTASLAMVGMALACLPCAWHLWRSPTPGVWAMTAGMDAGMALVHSQMLSGAPVSGATMAGMTASAGGGPAVGLMWLGLALVCTQLVLAGLAALHRYGRRRQERS
jgi:hypothetical protein